MPNETDPTRFTVRHLIDSRVKYLAQQIGELNYEIEVRERTVAEYRGTIARLESSQALADEAANLAKREEAERASIETARIIQTAEQLRAERAAPKPAPAPQAVADTPRKKPGRKPGAKNKKPGPQARAKAREELARKAEAEKNNNGKDEISPNLRNAAVKAFTRDMGAA